MISKYSRVFSPWDACNVSTYLSGDLAQHGPSTAFIPHLTISESFLSTPDACCTCWAVVLTHLIRNTPLNVSSLGHRARLSNFPIIHFLNLGTNIGLNDFRLHFNSNITCGWFEMQPAPFFFSSFSFTMLQLMVTSPWPGWHSTQAFNFISRFQCVCESSSACTQTNTHKNCLHAMPQYNRRHMSWGQIR